jgi:3-deoxy-D-manno-octulosonic-acid transferase
MLLYNLVVLAYGLLIKLASLRSEKAAQWTDGRRRWREKLRAGLKKTEGNEIVWIHCASYGEFEQGRPLIEAIRSAHPEKKILLSFFSPSGYEAFSSWEGADIVTYLPLDSRSNAKDFIQLVKPAAAIFIKYEFWLHFLRELKAQKVPAYLVSAVFKSHHPFFKWYGGIFRRSLHVFSHIFLQDSDSQKRLRAIGIDNTSVCGDTRFDRVLEIRKKFEPVGEIEAFKGSGSLIVAGSTWPGDTGMILEAFNRLGRNGLKLLIVPHQIDKRSIAQTRKQLDSAGISYSVFSTGVNYRSQALILDTMGMLSRSYHYADCAYIGGGFDGGIHNTLEPAVYEVPVTFFGKSYLRFVEARSLTGIGAARSCKDSGELAEAFNFFLDLETREKLAPVIRRYFSENANCTARIMERLSPVLRQSARSNSIKDRPTSPS